jgi:hypothetical protein
MSSTAKKKKKKSFLTRKLQEDEDFYSLAFLNAWTMPGT